MNLSLKIARRYLFAKKSTNAINIITGISVVGIAIGTAALVLVLSVFNGFEDLIIGLFSKFNPDVKVTATIGKTFEPDSAKLYQIKALPGVELVSETLEEVAFFEYGQSQDFGIVKGVDENYHLVSGIDSAIFEGRYRLTSGERNLAVLGGGVRNKLQVNMDDPFGLLSIFMAKREKTSGLEQPFKKRIAYPSGSFKIQQDFDNQYVLVSLEFARDLIGAYGEVSALEVKLKPGTDTKQAIAAIQDILGEEFFVKDRYQQEEAFLKLMNIEKWMSFALLCLTLVLVAFNMIGSLWMIVLEKKADISILKSMGATNGTVRNIFLGQGFLLCLFGLFSGMVLALILYALQKIFGIVPIPEGFVVDAYPISMRLVDVLAVSVVVVIIGLVASVPAAHRASKIPTLVREE
ncbi:MAG: ABC transporter permease [Saprospiraceae bacterium]|nr:ABC transporter permease [Saprospiraceae bacterium]MCF8251195.1 ABC transporter permease [Saprospiraceae bacterium]MCF8282372.1 ABC transporter permease [Bacteroidales bacterium]MCF8313007.1 ABC transporter permease [Saprospiraceae bacterium]MCF8441454.1 ABC transporter permease [Saprospiraceae bacterium]